MNLSATENYSLVGSVGDFRSNPLEFLTTNYNPQTPGFRFRAGWRFINFVGDPEYALFILRQTEKKFVKNRFYKRFQAAVGQGLGTSEGALWRRQRKLCQPAFTPQKLSEYATTIGDVVREHVSIWDKYAENGAPFPLHLDMCELTMKVFLRAMFGINADFDWRSVNAAFNVISEHQGTKFDEIISMPEYIPTPQNNKFRKALRVIDEFVMELIARNRSNPTKSLLSTLIASVDDETNSYMNDRQLRDELVTLIIGGYETSAVLATWIFVHLFDNPAVLEQVFNEIQTKVAGDVPSYDELGDLVYLEAVINESLRLTPPAWMLARVPLEDVTFKGVTFKKGTDIFLSPYISHRHSSYWDEPETFNPSRFLGMPSSARALTAFFPFGAGTRVCIGNQFSAVETKMVMGALLKKFSFKLVDRHQLGMKPALTLHPTNNVPTIASLRFSH